MNQILVVSHCILNHACKVSDSQKDEIRKEKANRNRFMHYVLNHDIQLIQLPCPEFMMYGCRRWGHVKDQFNHPFFRKKCQELLEPLILQLKEYAAYPDRFQILAIVAIDGSPSCGYHLTCTGDWGGEFLDASNLHEKIGNLTMKDEAGVFMEELKKFLEEEQLPVPIKDLSTIVQELC